MSLAEREELSIHYAQGLSLRTIARGLNRSPTMISRELARNRTGFYYRAVTAQRKAARRCSRKPRRLAVDSRLCHTVLGLLR
jgi:IS30 family transposase